MRIAIVTRAARKLGGVETHIEALLPALERAGCALSIVFESEVDLSRPPMQLPSKTQCWSVKDHGSTVARMRLTSWAPDLIYVHGIEDIRFEEQIQRIAPSVFYAHDYYGQCISGSKTFRIPNITPCSRQFGSGCLACYLPRGCGGKSPATMLRMYHLQKQRQQLLRDYRRVLTNSRFLATSLELQGIRAECLYLFGTNAPTDPPALGKSALPAPGEPWRLLFLGRAHSLKGGDLLLKSLPLVIEKIDRSVSITFAGDGPALPSWRRIADKISSARIQINFVGWSTNTAELFRKTHLVVMPSVWPEPFGLVGIEAGLHAVPTVAFATGGIPEWLHDGENGHLAPAAPPSASGLAEAISRAICDHEHYLRLRASALMRAREFSLTKHIQSLLRVFEGVSNHSILNNPTKVVVA